MVTTASIDEFSARLLDAVAQRHGLQGRSAALRHVLTAIAPHYLPPDDATPPPPKPNGRPTKAALVARRRQLIDPAQAPLELRAELCAWIRDGIRPAPLTLEQLRAYYSDETLNRAFDK